MLNATGLIVTGRTQIDNNLIGEIVETSEFSGEFNTREGYWFFEESRENYDALETALSEIFDFAEINARIEGVWN
jgi:hypothetical protein